MCACMYIYQEIKKLTRAQGLVLLLYVFEDHIYNKKMNKDIINMFQNTKIGN